MAAVEVVHVRKPSEVMLRQMADLHVAAIPSGFLTSLGPHVLRRIYAAIIGSPHAFALVALCDSDCVGFLCAAESTRRVQISVITRAWPWLLPQLIGHAFKARVLWRLGELAFYTFRSRGRSLATPAAEILNFCVDARFRGLGIGQLLFQEMESEYRRRGVELVCIVTGSAQLDAQRLYERNGANRVGEVAVHAGVKSLLYVYHIGQPVGPVLAPLCDGTAGSERP